jgi:hypothetical protein
VVASVRFYALHTDNEEVTLLLIVETSQLEFLKQLLHRGIKLTLEWDLQTLTFENVEKLKVSSLLTVPFSRMAETSTGERYEIWIDISKFFWDGLQNKKATIQVQYMDTTQTVPLLKTLSSKVSFPQAFDTRGKPIYRFAYKLSYQDQWRYHDFPFIFVKD